MLVLLLLTKTRKRQLDYHTIIDLEKGNLFTEDFCFCFLERFVAID
jgi:hypothetical protein